MYGNKAFRKVQPTFKTVRLKEQLCFTWQCGQRSQDLDFLCSFLESNKLNYKIYIIKTNTNSSQYYTLPYDYYDYYKNASLKCKLSLNLKNNTFHISQSGLQSHKSITMKASDSRQKLLQQTENHVAGHLVKSSCCSTGTVQIPIFRHCFHFQ